MSSDRWCMFWSCFMMRQTFGSADGLLCSGSNAYDGMGIISGSFPLVNLARDGAGTDMSGALRFEAVVQSGLAAVMLLDGSSSLEKEFASMVLDLDHPALDLFLPFLCQHNMLHIWSSEEGQNFVYDVFVGVWYMHCQKADVRFQFDPGGR